MNSKRRQNHTYVHIVIPTMWEPRGWKEERNRVLGETMANHGAAVSHAPRADTKPVKMTVPARMVVGLPMGEVKLLWKSSKAIVKSHAPRISASTNR